MEGGSFGLQAGGGEIDLLVLVMNKAGAEKMLKSQFKLGGEAGVMAGPIGRAIQAGTDASMRAEILSWSRSRGVFAGVSVEGSTFREDLDDNSSLYGHKVSNEEMLTKSGIRPPEIAEGVIAELNEISRWEKR